MDKQKVNEIISKVISDSGRATGRLTLNSDTHLRDDLGYDSFLLAELTVHLEEEFGVDIFENGIINTVGEVYSRLEN